MIKGRENKIEKRWRRGKKKTRSGSRMVEGWMREEEIKSEGYGEEAKREASAR